MSWFTLSCFFFGLFIGIARHRRKIRTPADKPSQPAPEKTDPVMDAVLSGDIEKMIAAADLKTDPETRHDLLQKIVEYAYKHRAEPAMKQRLAEFARVYLNEFPELLPAVERTHPARPLYLPIFKLYAIHLEEENAYDEALRVCRIALDHNLDDQTRTGFEGRIQRIGKKRDRNKK